MADLRLRCVKISDQAETQEVLKQAYKVFKDQNFEPVWFKQEECLKVSQKEKNTIYVFDTFEGDAFHHIAELGCRVLGPMSILTSVALNKHIPKMTSPLYNMAMKDVVVCFTNLDTTVREKLQKLVLWMGGLTMKAFTEDVTHLVAGVVGSKKYLVAAEMGKHIMLPKWVELVWEKAKFDAVHGLDEQFQEYKCPVFMGCLVTVSGLGSQERKEVKKLVEKEGGEYSGEMKVKETTHLIINEPKGQKYEFALKWQLKVVRSDWLYESIEKGFCQDETKYEVKTQASDIQAKGGMKTSTPERRSLAGGIHDISNISAISMMNVEESRLVNMTTRLEEPDPLDTLDMTKSPSEMFLDGCKVFLSGFRGATLDKLRKIINAGGATRCNQITDNVTHVVLGEKIISDLEQVKSLSTRPHTVTSNWLIECFKQEKHLEETNFYSSELPAPEPMSPQMKKPLKRPRAPRESNVTAQPVGKPSEKNHSTEDENDDMQEIMSQYLTNQDQGGNETNDITMAPENAIEMDDDLTQDPDKTTSTQIEGGVFMKKTFMLFGFEEEHIPVLTNFIKENGGKVLQLNARSIPDYAVVPIDGFPVDKTVNSIVTNVWLQMCIEQNQLLPVNSNSFFTPLEIQIDKTPLKDCVLSISGYIGVERDCLMYIAGILGANTQEYFVRNAKKGLLPSTHLVVNAPEGSKYQAAKNWGIPAVTKSWLLACAETGNKEDETKYLTDDSAENENRMVEPPDKVNNAVNQQNQSSSRTDQSEPPLQNQENQQNQSSARTDQSEPPLQNQKTGPVTIKENEARRLSDRINNVKISCEAEIEKENEVGNIKQNGRNSNKGADSSNTGRDGFEEFSTMGDTEAMMLEVNTQDGAPASTGNNCDKNTHADKTVTSDSRGADVETIDMDTGTPTVSIKGRQSLSRKMILDRPSGASQKENLATSGRSTPVQSRVKELQQTTSISAAERVTPSKFLNPDKRFYPNFDIDDLLTDINTPEHVRAKRATKRKDSLPLEELFTLKLEQARHTIAKATELKTMQQSAELSQKNSNEMGSDATSDVLRGVVISVSKKLGKEQAELNDIVSTLGGDYTWNLDSSCTHFIFQGRANDTSKEFRTVRNQETIKIVSPHWLYMCKEQRARVDESLFPHNFNPNLSLSVVSTKRTPLRKSARSMRRGLSDRNHSNKEVISIGEETKEVSGRLANTDNSDGAVTKGDKALVEACLQENEMKSPERSNSDEDKRVPDPNSEIDMGSLEMREVLSKQLENVMAESVGKKRRKSKRLNNSGQISTPEDIQNSSTRQTRRTQEDMKNTSGRPSRGASGKGEEKFSGDIAQSQSVQVVWDDPMGRMEQEKLAEKLERACSPTQEVDDGHIDLDIPADAQYSDTDPEPEVVVTPFSNQEAEPSKSTPKVTRQNSNRTPTPEGPPLAFPTVKSKKITPPRPVEPMEEETSVKKEPPVFILSGMSQAEKDDYGALIEQLGGTVFDALSFDSRCTHLVISTVIRNEKFLASIASGKWILHKSYFEACRQEGRFVQEDFYEWGSEGTLSLVKNMESNVRMLAAAARQWRIRIQEEKKVSDKFGAFCTWTVILCCDKNKEANYKRLLEAGGACVVSQRPPFTSDIDATHVLIEPHRVQMTQEDFEALLSSGCLCLRPDFISAHLSNPEADVDDYCPQEIKALKAALSGTPKKRKASTNQTAVKRSRRR